jgi:hypothetical protein
MSEMSLTGLGTFESVKKIITETNDQSDPIQSSRINKQTPIKTV